MNVKVSDTIAMERFMAAHPEIVYAETRREGWGVIAVIGGCEYGGIGETLEAAYAAMAERAAQ